MRPKIRYLLSKRQNERNSSKTPIPPHLPLITVANIGGFALATIPPRNHEPEVYQPGVKHPRPQHPALQPQANLKPFISKSQWKDPQHLPNLKCSSIWTTRVCRSAQAANLQTRLCGIDTNQIVRWGHKTPLSDDLGNETGCYIAGKSYLDLAGCAGKYLRGMDFVYTNPKS